ncbi:hypothetical protein IJV79_00825 [bacterium]|nr:hypothetical protein [bacterium]
MKKLLLVLAILFLALPVFCQTLLHTKVSVREIPNSFFGNWRVESVLASTNAPNLFKQKSVDFWNLSRAHDVINLENPFSGASQTVTVRDVTSEFIKFTKVGNYDGRRLTDEVTINIDDDVFRGVNELKLETISGIDGHVMKTDYATYHIKGEKLSGTSMGN